jgi:hypothetical protein
MHLFFFLDHAGDACTSLLLLILSTDIIENITCTLVPIRDSGVYSDPRVPRS